MSFYYSTPLNKGSLSLFFSINSTDQLSVDLPKSVFEPAGVVCFYNFNDLK